MSKGRATSSLPQKRRKTAINSLFVTFRRVLYVYIGIVFLPCMYEYRARPTDRFVCSNKDMTRISEVEFSRIVEGIVEDRGAIIRHNPIGTPEKTLLWMLLSALVVYLSLNEVETPCFTGRADARVYRDAIEFILRDRMTDTFDPIPLLDKLSLE